MVLSWQIVRRKPSSPDDKWEPILAPFDNFIAAANKATEMNAYALHWIYKVIEREGAAS
jgi:hypothetical protein